jgi:putative membrane protein
VIEMMTGWYGMGFIGVLGMALFWIAVLAVIVLVVRDASGGSHHRSAAAVESPTDVLKARYARGEIARDEYERMLRDLAA